MYVIRVVEIREPLWRPPTLSTGLPIRVPTRAALLPGPLFLQPTFLRVLPVPSMQIKKKTARCFLYFPDIRLSISTES